MGAARRFAKVEVSLWNSEKTRGLCARSCDGEVRVEGGLSRCPISCLWPQSSLCVKRLRCHSTDVECGRKGRLREGRKRTLQSALVSSVMRLNPQQAPVYGESLLTVQLCDGELNLDEREVEFYLLFTGSTQRHLATTLRSSRATLQTICPSHDCCEPVQVTLCASRPGQPMEPVAEGRLCFVQDLAFDVAQILVGAAGQPDGLEGLLQLDECQLAPCEQLDCNLTLALQHLALPQDWNVLGPSTGSEPTPQETLLHFAARRGLPRVAAFLLQRSGGREALRLPNRQGETPLSLAESRGHTQLQLLLSQTEILPGTENGAPPLHCAGGHAVRHHPSLDTYTLTEPLANGAQPTGLLEDAEELRRVICCGGPSFQVASDLLHTTLQRCGSLRVTEEEDDLLRKARHSSDSTVSLSKSGQENGGETSVCDCGGGSEGLQLPSDNGSNEGCECPCENSCVESTRRMERELGTAPVNIVDSINRPHKTESSPVWEEGLGAAFSELPFGARQEETDITHGTISTTQKSLEADSKENQEAVSKAERAVETQTCDNSETVCAGSSSTVENMGHSQSQGDQEISDGEPEDQTSQETEQIELSVTEVDNCRLLHEKSLQDGEGDVTPAEVAEEICAVQKSSVLSLGLQGSVGNEEATAGSERSSTVAAEQGSIEDQCKLETSHSEQSKETPAVDCVAAERDNGTGAHGESTARSQLAGANCDEQDKEDTEKPRDPASSDEPSSDVMAQQPHEEKGGERESEDTGCTERQSCECASEPLLSYTTCEKETLLQAAKSATDGDHEDLHAPSADPVVESKEPLTLVNESAVCCVLVVETSNTSREDNESICDITDVNLDADTSFSTNGDNSPEADAVIKEQGAHISSDATSTQDVTPEETDKENICDEDASELKSGAVSQFASEEQGTKDLSEVTSVLEMGPEKTVEDEGGVCAEESGAAQLDMMPVLHVEEDTVHSENESGRITGPNEVTTIQEVSFEKTMENQQSVCVEDTTDAKMDAACEFPFNDSSVQSVGSPRVAEEQVNIPDDLVSTMEVDPREKSEPVEEQTFSPTETQSPLGVVSEGQEGSESGEVPKASLVTEADLQLPCSEQSAEPPEETARTENLSQQEHVEENNGSELRREHQAIELQTEVIVQKPPMSPDSQSDEVHQEGLVARGQLSDSQVTQVSDPEILVEVTLDTAVTVVSSEELPLETLPAVPEEPTDNSVCVSKETMTSEAASESVSETDIGTAAAWVATPPEAPGDAVHLDPRSHTSEEISPEPTSTSAGSDSHGSVGLGEFSNLVDNKRDLVVGLELPRTLDMVEEVSEEGYEDAPDGDTPTAGTEMSPVLGTREGDAKEEIHREKETCCSVDSCVDPSNVGQVQRSRCPEFPDSLAPQAAGSSGSTPQPDSSHDADGLFCTDPADDSVFQKGEGTPAGDSVSEASASCSSTDDTSSTGPTSSALGWSTGDTSWSSEEARPAGDLGGDAEEEAKDRLTEVPVCSAILRSSARSLSPFRRHSWEPGRNSGREAEMSPRSSLRTLGEGRPTFHKRSMSWCPSDHPRPDADELGSRSYSLEGLSADRDAGKETIPQAAVPRDADRLQQLDSRERGSLGSLTEEEQETHAGDYSSLDSKKSASPQLPRHSCQSMTLPLTKSVSMLAISHKELDSMWPSSKVSPPQGYGVSDEDPVRLRGCPEGKSGTKVSRTFSYLKNKMIKKNKDKDKNKAKDQETKEKEKTLNGHVFSTTNCAPSVQCTQCNKAIGGKEASFCSTSRSVRSSSHPQLHTCLEKHTRVKVVEKQALRAGKARRSCLRVTRCWSAVARRALPEDEQTARKRGPPVT
ncbi:A-kinase anchor protein 13-like isoform X1 [Arapaima gigas]